VNNTKMLVKQLEKKCNECPRPMGFEFEAIEYRNTELQKQNDDLKYKISTQDEEYIALAQKLVALQNENTETISKLKLEVMLKAEEIEKLYEKYEGLQKQYNGLIEGCKKHHSRYNELFKENTELKKQLRIINRRTFLQEIIHRIRLKINPFCERGNKNV